MEFQVGLRVSASSRNPSTTDEAGAGDPGFLWSVRVSMVGTTTMHKSRGQWRCVSIIDDIVLYGRSELLRM